MTPAERALLLHVADTQVQYIQHGPTGCAFSAARTTQKMIDEIEGARQAVDDWAVQAARRYFREGREARVQCRQPLNMQDLSTIIREEHARSAAPQAVGEATELIADLTSIGKLTPASVIIAAGNGPVFVSETCKDAAATLTAQAAEIERLGKDAFLWMKAAEAAESERDRMREALGLAGRAFRQYENIHRDKGTSEGHLKAEANRQLAEEMERAALSGSENK